MTSSRSDARSKLLVTGADGLVGRILLDALADTFEVVGCDVAGPFTADVLPLDIRDEDAVTRLFAEVQPEYVVHLAGNAEVKAPWASVLHDNIAGTHSVFQAALASAVKRIVFASSNHVTGAYEGFPPKLHLEQDPRKITVSSPLRPDSLYGVGKVFGEALARYYFERFGLEAVCLRIGSVLADDDPAQSARLRKTWLSHRDLVQLVRRSLLADVKFGIYYGVSNNTGAFWSLANARAELGYVPEDDGSQL